MGNGYFTVFGWGLLINLSQPRINKIKTLLKIKSNKIHYYFHNYLRNMNLEMHWEQHGCRWTKNLIFITTKDAYRLNVYGGDWDIIDQNFVKKLNEIDKKKLDEIAKLLDINDYPKLYLFTYKGS